MTGLANHFPTGCWHQPDGSYAGECSCGASFTGPSYAEAKQAWADHAVAPAVAIGAGERWKREDTGALPWAYGWFDDGGGKHVLPYLPTVAILRGVSSDAFPLFRAPASASIPADVQAEARLRAKPWDRNAARDILRSKLGRVEGYLGSDVRDIIDSHDIAEEHDPDGIVYACIEAMIDFAVETSVEEFASLLNSASIPADVERDDERLTVSDALFMLEQEVQLWAAGTKARTAAERCRNVMRNLDRALAARPSTGRAMDGEGGR